MKLLTSKYSHIIVIVMVAAATYVNTLYNGFVFDDNNQVLKNPWITDIRYLGDILSSPVWGFRAESEGSDYYRPMLHIIYMAEYHIFGFKPVN